MKKINIYLVFVLSIVAFNVLYGTSLHQAALKSDVLSILRCIKAKADVNARLNNDKLFNRATPLDLSCTREAALTLLNYGANSKASDAEFFILYGASNSKQLLIEDYEYTLQEALKDPSQIWLKKAIEVGYVRIVQMLLQAAVLVDRNFITEAEKYYNEAVGPGYKDAYKRICALLRHHLGISQEYLGISKNGISGFPEHIQNNIARFVHA